jgi:hypothetical protein
MYYVMITLQKVQNLKKNYIIMKNKTAKKIFVCIIW